MANTAYRSELPSVWIPTMDLLYPSASSSSFLEPRKNTKLAPQYGLGKVHPPQTDDDRIGPLGGSCGGVHGTGSLRVGCDLHTLADSLGVNETLRVRSDAHPEATTHITPPTELDLYDTAAVNQIIEGANHYNRNILGKENRKA